MRHQSSVRALMRESWAAARDGTYAFVVPCVRDCFGEQVRGLDCPRCCKKDQLS